MFKQILLAFTSFFSAIYANKDTTYTDFYIALKQSNVYTLKSTLLDISNPKSAKYGKFLDTEYVNKLVSPPQEEKQLIYNWLETNDIKVIKDYGDCIKSYGSLKSIDNIFGVDMIEYEKNKYWSEKPYKIPDKFKKTVVFVEGISNKFPLNKRINPRSSYIMSEKVDSRYVGQEAFYWLYNISSENLNVQSSVASIEYGGGNGFNIDDFQAAQKLNNVSVTNVTHVVDCSPGADVESQLDMQMMAINGGVNTDVWYWANDNWLYSLAVDMFNNDTIPDVVSMSYGWAEDDQCSITQCDNETSAQYVDRVNIEYVKLGLRGVTITVSSGDAGAPGRTSEGCDSTRPLNSAFPGSSPWITSVGATFVVDNGQTRDWKSKLCVENGCIGSKEQRVTNFAETGWTSGGGVAKLSSRISIQDQAVRDYINSDVSLPHGYNENGRMYPDVTAIGHYCPVIDGGGLDAVDGTSCSSPLFATIVTLLNQHQIANGKPKLGFINPVLYMMYYENVSAFGDITEGNIWCTEQACCDMNKRNGSDFGYSAAVGYDPVYGLGTPNVGVMMEWLDRNT